MSTYLDDQVLESLLVLWSLLVELALQAVHGEHFESLKALVALFHLLHAHFVVLASDHLFVLDLSILHLLLVQLGQLVQLLVVDALRLFLAIALAEHLDLERLLVGILAHHSLQLEGITV